MLERNLDRSQQEFLSDRMHVLQTIDSTSESIEEELDEEVHQETATHQYLRFHTRVLSVESDGHRRILAQTNNMRRALPAQVFPPAPPGDEPRVEHWHDPRSQRDFLLMVAHAPWRVHAGRAPVIQMALDVTPSRLTLAEFRRVLAILLGIGVMLSTASALYLARRGLRPLDEITHAAESITVDQLGERIGQRPWPAELRALASAFDTMLERLDDSFTRLSQFSADLAHELRTPINNLMGQTEIVLSQDRSPAEYRDVLGSNLEELGRLAAVVENLLFLARADNAEQVAKRVDFDAGGAIDAVHAMFEAVAEDKGVSIERRGSATVAGEPMLVRRALSNLLDNALEHTPPGGHIEIVAREQADGAEIVVRDDGEGIAPEHLPHVCERLYRADSSRGDGRGSSGLGLAIVASIMKLHGGEISVDSAAGRGTEVTLRFPIPAAS